ncbi:hypothetical protein [Streptomyces sp. TRM70350]|uniref:hypothetical protein n=1 Tax=Streptomyces sp. TRM70350 TaxID=2856165 RepID=UPI001C47FEA8|nr:hypothetical protein [Streptomyces sp. TRM70350]MBV7699068.1 hypothetical protein [Streptomyces sp. TRM70350]
MDNLAGRIGAHVARWSLKAHVNDKYVAAEPSATSTHEGKLRARTERHVRQRRGQLHRRRREPAEPTPSWLTS